MVDETAENLREMAQHRGLKLVKSRRRKPGTGDFGKFGLIDEQGKPLLGIGDDGLTASAEDIQDFLRAGAASTWQQSAKIVPDQPVPHSARERGGAEESAVRRRGRGEMAPTGSVKRANSLSPRSSPRHESRPVAEDGRSRAAAVRRDAARGKAEPVISSPIPPEQPATPKSVEPELVLRPARPADAGALAKLLGQLSGASPSEDGIARDLAALRKAGAGVHVAELGSLIGCIGWAVVPTLQGGQVGRITVLVVDEDHRRQGIATRLLCEAEVALAKKGCALIEAMSDIEIKNSHNFFRTLKFDQTSYRFAREIAR